MNRAAVALLALLALVGCVTTDNVPSPAAHLPALPGDLARCFNQSLGRADDADMTVEQAERAWKSDRLRFVVQQKCGRRVVAWYESLRQSWK